MVSAQTIEKGEVSWYFYGSPVEPNWTRKRYGAKACGKVVMKLTAETYLM